jgi:pantoate--beta-alanine ligase
LEAHGAHRVNAIETLRTPADLRAAVQAARRAGSRVALVPTMGALHDGHLALVREAGREADFVIASVFVNPLQFGPDEDFARYPRDEARDAALLAGAGCHLLFAPPVGTVYRHGFATRVHVARLGDAFEGAVRPGHFDGVATVVLKLLLMAAPDVALFGEKDWQQLALVRRMASDLDVPARIVGVPTVRDADGLALSSRNAYLTPEARLKAAAFPAALRAAVGALEAGGAIGQVLHRAERAILAGGFSAVDYVALVDADTLAPLACLDRPARLLAAARIGATRLLDNFPVQPA